MVCVSAFTFLCQCVFFGVQKDLRPVRATHYHSSSSSTTRYYYYYFLYYYYYYFYN